MLPVITMEDMINVTLYLTVILGENVQLVHVELNLKMATVISPVIMDRVFMMVMIALLTNQKAAQLSMLFCVLVLYI